MISLFVVYCLTANPYICRTLEVVPYDGRAMTSIPECTKGGAVGSMIFSLEDAEWQVKGFRCLESKGALAARLKERVSP